MDHVISADTLRSLQTEHEQIFGQRRNMSAISEQVLQAINDPEVQEIAQKLAKYGLGIFVPHMHHEETGLVSPLPKGMLSVEQNQVVTFRSADEVLDEHFVPVGWRWNEELEVFSVSSHHRFGDIEPPIK